jgi:mannose-6-phosphate isomerase-like protein (cupin superfamily)
VLLSEHVGAFHADSDESVHADHWERHTAGQELLYVVSGALAVHLREYGDGPVVTLTSGQAFIVPAGKWHRLSVREPGDLVTVSPRPGTEHERVSSRED